MYSVYNVFLCDPVRGIFVVRTEDTRLPTCVLFVELMGSACYLGNRENSAWGDSRTISELSVSTPTSERLQPRTKGNGTRRRSTGWNFSSQDEMDCCSRESQGWTTACSSMPERDGKDQGQDTPKQAFRFRTFCLRYACASAATRNKLTTA